MCVGWTLRSLIASAYGMLAFVFPLASLAQQTPQPKFTSGGIQVVVNRAVRPGPQPQLAISLVLTNIGDDDVAIFADQNPMVIADTGGSATAAMVSGVPVCNVSPALPYCLENTGLTPAVIESQKSITVLMVFAAHPNRRICSIDFNMPLYIYRGGRSASWRRITVGLPNVRVC